MCTKKNITKYPKFQFIASAVFLLFFLITLNQAFSWSDKSFVSFSITPLHVTIGSSWDISLPIISPSFDTWEIQANFSPNSFRLDDRKASDIWYITTIQSSDLVFNNWVEDVRISNYNIRFMTSISPSLIYGLANTRVTFWSSIKNIRWNIWKPLVYFKRDPWPNLWSIWRYGDTPSIKIIIPPAQSPWVYTWTIYFTLISW